MLQTGNCNSDHNPCELISHNGFASVLFEHGSHGDVIPCDLAKTARLVSGGFEVDTTRANLAQVDFHQMDGPKMILKPEKTHQSS